MQDGIFVDLGIEFFVENEEDFILNIKNEELKRIELFYVVKRKVIYIFKIRKLLMLICIVRYFFIK